MCFHCITLLGIYLQQQLREDIRLRTPISLATSLDEAKRVEHVLHSPGLKHLVRQAELNESESER